MTKSPTPTPSLAELMALLGSEVGVPLNTALERLQAALAARAPSESLLLAVREPLRRARDATVIASQIGRLVSGRVQPERLPCALHSVLGQVVDLRRREAQARGLQLRLETDEAEVRSDPALLPRLLHALLDWALMHTRSSLELRLRVGAWPPEARLTLRFATRDLDQAASSSPNALNAQSGPNPPGSPECLDALDGLRWQLLVQMAAVLGVAVRREDESSVCVTRLDIPLLQAEELPKLHLQLPPDSPALNSQPFAGWTALVVSPDAQLQRELSQLMEPLGWALDRAASVDDAFQQALRALPHAVVVDGALAGADLDQWRAHLLGEAPNLCFVEVHAEAPARVSSRAAVCTHAELSGRLPQLLRKALAPRSQELTFRL